MGGLESVITGVIDQNRNFLKNFRYRRELLTFVTILGAFAFALPSVTNVNIQKILNENKFFIIVLFVNYIFISLIIKKYVAGRNVCV